MVPIITHTLKNKKATNFQTFISILCCVMLVLYLQRWICTGCRYTWELSTMTHIFYKLGDAERFLQCWRLLSKCVRILPDKVSYFSEAWHALSNILAFSFLVPSGILLEQGSDEWHRQLSSALGFHYGSCFYSPKGAIESPQPIAFIYLSLLRSSLMNTLRIRHSYSSFVSTFQLWPS